MKLDVGLTAIAHLQEHAETVLVSIPAEKGAHVPPKLSAPSKITELNVLAVLVSPETDILNVSLVRITVITYYCYSIFCSFFNHFPLSS